MGVIYKLKDEVVQFIISQRQVNPLSSCRQLAELASEKFGVHLSKSSVHDVLKESGVITPRGRKPKDKFKIPQEKKKQIQDSLSLISILPPEPFVIQDEEKTIIPKPEDANDDAAVALNMEQPATGSTEEAIALPAMKELEKSQEYQGAGRIFLKAAFWDLGIYSEEHIKEDSWRYYLTYSKGIKVSLENDKSFFIELPLPLERCIREVADGLINNVRSFMVQRISDQELFKASMENQAGFKIKNVTVVDEKNHNMFELYNIVECKRKFIVGNRYFVENYEKDPMERARTIFFPQMLDNKAFTYNILNINGFDTINKQELVVNLVVDSNFNNKTMLLEAVEKFNGMRLCDDQDRLVKVKI